MRNPDPVNKQAAISTSKGTHYNSKKTILQVCQRDPLPTYRPKSNDLTGTRRGRLTVVGLFEGSKRYWVCRCDCGNYVVRRAKAIRNENNDQDRCDECRQLAYLQRADHYRQTGKDKDIKEF